MFLSFYLRKLSVLEGVIEFKKYIVMRKYHKQKE
jgi:hypothetical protein